MAHAGKDYYRALGVAENADAAAIKEAYRKLAKRHHPDANPDNPKAAERFKAIGEAYGVLSDPAKRKKYDQMRKLGAFGLGDARPGPKTGAASGAPGFSFEDLGGLGGFSDIFSSIFDRARKERGPRPPGPRKGRNVEYSVDVSFTTAANGGKIALTVPITEKCARCDGSGGAPGAEWKRCAECGGSGTVSFGQGTFAVKRPCPACASRGRQASEPCAACEGAGKIRQRRKMHVAVPPGAQTGQKVRVPGQGESGEGGGARGDLLITFKVKPHRFFRREGSDIHASVTVNFAQAMLGARIRVATVSGDKAQIRVPPGTQPGTRFRIKGQGIRRDGRAGDQIVEVKVKLPESLSSEERERVKELADLSGMKR